MRKSWLFAAVGACLSIIAVPALAAPAKPVGQNEAPVLQGDGTVVSHHTITLANGKKLSYTARAGFLPLRRDNARSGGETLAQMFFVAYTADSQPGVRRPVTFSWGGGPGSSSTLSGDGPRKLKAAKDYANGAPPPYEIVDNPDTWLDMTDIVMVDEIGTGYSRMTSPDYAHLFYTADGDADAFAEFIRIYTRRYDTTSAPIFLKGGSYGSIRGALVSSAAEKRNIPIRGLVLSAIAITNGADDGDLAASWVVPSYTAAAFHHKLLSPELMADRDKTIKAAEDWTTGPYAVALARGNSLNESDRKQIAEQYARFTGLKPELVLANNLRVPTAVFTNELLRDQGKIVGAYDTRIAVKANPQAFDPTKDPSLNLKPNAASSMMERIYFSKELGVNADLLGPAVDSVHLGPMGGAWPGPKGGAWPDSAAQTNQWMAVLWGEQGEPIPSNVPQIFEKNVETNKNLDVLLMTGRFDLATRYMANRYLQTHVRPEALSRVKVVVPESGHSVPEGQVKAAVRDLYAKALAEPAPSGARSSPE
jgi:carboxypeptidase C (cathepsin A)